MLLTDPENQEKARSSDSLIAKLDKHGIPLVPQPTDDPRDPLNWKPWLKHLVLAEVSLYTLLTLLSASAITPTFQILSKEFHTSVERITYITSIFVLLAGASSALWNPIAEVYGRRPVYLTSVTASVALLFASGASKSYVELLTFRALHGFFGGVSLGLGSATICDLYFEHERGRYLGVYTLSLITGGHLAPILGGYIERDLTWRWCFYIGGILLSPL